MPEINKNTPKNPNLSPEAQQISRDLLNKCEAPGQSSTMTGREKGTGAGTGDTKKGGGGLKGMLHSPGVSDKMEKIYEDRLGLLY